MLSQEPPLVFIHGLKGGGLCDAEGKSRWLHISQGLGLDRRGLKAPLTWDEKGQSQDGWQPTGPLRKVLGQSIYSEFLNWAEEKRKDFSAFSYDWRRDPHESVAQLISYLDQRKEELKKPSQIIAHSLGGLIAFMALRQRPDLFHSVLFAGVPFGPGVSFVTDMHHGSSVGLNKKVLDIETHFSWASPWCFFPLEGPTLVTDSHHKRVKIKWYEVESWETHGLSIFAHPDKVTPAHREHLKRALAQAAQFRSSLMATEGLEDLRIPIGVLSSEAHDTVSELVCDKEGDEVKWNFSAGKHKGGDGRVGVAETRPPPPLVPRCYNTKDIHEHLLNNTELVADILDDLCLRV